MKIVISTIYGESYTKDKLFDNSACNIGENLLMPNILLKKELEKKGHEVHTADVVNQFDAIIFQDIPQDSWLTIESFSGRIKYILKRKWKKDYLYRAVKGITKERIFLQINEPPTVAPQSYNASYHQYFGKVFTWNDNLVDGNKYIKFCIPQYWDGKMYKVPFKDKRDFVVIAGNKSSAHPNELYTKRREVIEYFEKQGDLDFSLYGFGWEKENYNNYRGTVGRKLETLSKYKFCFCFENIKDCPGYITEKIFDCFFAGCVPIYLGAGNIETYINKELFIDMRDYKTVDEVVGYVEQISESKYMDILSRINAYLTGKRFNDTFACNNYVKVISEGVTDEKRGIGIYKGAN